MRLPRMLSVVVLCLLPMTLIAAEPLGQPWDYAAAMKKVAKDFMGNEGVVIHIGDSITYANPYSQWAIAGEGKTDADKALLDWMHMGQNNDTDGWWLARFDHPSGGRSHTAAGGMRLDECLTGGKSGLPSLAEMLTTYKPRMVVLMLGSNDASQGRKVGDFAKDAQTSVKTILAVHAIPIVSTIPPHIGRIELAKSYNETLRAIARHEKLPLIDYEREILTRRPDDWNGTLLNKDDVHPTAETGGENGVRATSAPTDENLKQSGYLLRGWLSVRKIGEIKQKVLD